MFLMFDLMRKDEDLFDKCPHLFQIIPTASFLIFNSCQNKGTY